MAARKGRKPSDSITRNRTAEEIWEEHCDAIEGLTEEQERAIDRIITATLLDYEMSNGVASKKGSAWEALSLLIDREAETGERMTPGSQWDEPQIP